MKSTYVNKLYQLPAILTDGSVTILATCLDSVTTGYRGTVINTKNSMVNLGEYRKNWSVSRFFLSTEQIILEN